MRILAITSEALDTVRPFAVGKGITYTVGISRSASEAYGGGGIPHAYLIAPDGTVAWEGHPASLANGDIEKHLRKVEDFHIRKVASSVAPAAAAFRKGQLAEAETLAKAVAAGDPAASDAQHVVDRVGQLRAYWRRQVEQGTADGTFETVFDALDALQKHFKGGEDAEWAASKRKELDADPAVKTELKASKELQKLVEERQEAGTQQKKLDEVAKRVEKFVKKHEGTRTAKRAELLLKEIRSKPGK